MKEKNFINIMTHIYNLDKHIKSLDEVLNNKLIEPLFEEEENLINELEKIMNDKNKFISWFIFENEYGERKLKVNNKIITTSKQIYKIIIKK